MWISNPGGAPSALKSPTHQPFALTTYEIQVALTMLDPIVHEELPSDETSCHDHPRTQAREEAAEASFLREDLQTVGHRACGTMAFIDLGEEGVCGLKR